jgi:striatin 1/3/4
MLAHPASISSLDVDETGETLITSCHESSIRFWNIGSRKCDQDLSAHQTHRRKNDEVPILFGFVLTLAGNH